MKPNYLNDHPDAVGLRIARQLDQSTEQLPYRVSERLANARKAAVASLNPVQQTKAAASVLNNGSSTGVLSDSSIGWAWLRNSAVIMLPLIALIIGLSVISVKSEDLDATAEAEIDAALLLDDVPISTYTDRGFGVHIHNVRQ